MRRKMVETSYGEYELYVNDCKSDCLKCMQCPVGQHFQAIVYEEC